MQITVITRMHWFWRFSEKPSQTIAASNESNARMEVLGFSVFADNSLQRITGGVA